MAGRNGPGKGRKASEQEDGEDEKLRAHLGVPPRFKVLVDHPVTQSEIEHQSARKRSILVIVTRKQTREQAEAWTSENVVSSRRVIVVWTPEDSAYALPPGCLDVLSTEFGELIAQGSVKPVPVRAGCARASVTGTMQSKANSEETADRMVEILNSDVGVFAWKIGSAIFDGYTVHASAITLREVIELANILCRREIGPPDGVHIMYEEEGWQKFEISTRWREVTVRKVITDV